MNSYHKSCVLSFDIVDELTKDANTMTGLQENKAGCIREVLLDFIRANGIVNNYNEIPKYERLEKFFGFTGSEKAANAVQYEKKEADKHKCCCQFELTSIDRVTNDALVMLFLYDNKTLLIRELFLDFVYANGIVKNYIDIPKKERLSRFFGYVTKAVLPAKKPGITVRMLKEKSIEVCQYYEGKRYVSSSVVYVAPDGKKVSLMV